ncbi:neutral zinc metallopeptidase [Pseudomonas sp. BN417]|uniref:neutral zinc metallopeptidase n=1 Tax=Pseudomonas sp. BN417 TaxID=2567890 RepID=UPI0024562052|nr:neutral zinc metallopeptidase [Pseudomonas sp. BN417]
MPAKTTAPRPRKGLLLRLLRGLAWVLIVVTLVGVALYLGFGPAHLIDRLKPAPPAFPEQVTAEPEPPAAAAVAPAPVNAPGDSRELVKALLESNEDIWGEFLARGDYAYKKPKVVLYEGRVESPCKPTGAASGAFYCAKGMTLYLDLAYLDELQKRAPEVGDFARSYVVAHAVAHHVQNLVGAVGWIKEYRAKDSQAEGAESLEETEELLADCLVGSWASYAQRKYPWIRPQDMDKALQTVVALGRERAKAQDQPAMPHPLTEGDIAKRAEWFHMGVESGDPRECNQLFGGVEP